MPVVALVLQYESSGSNSNEKEEREIARSRCCLYRISDITKVGRSGEEKRGPNTEKHPYLACKGTFFARSL